MKVGLEHLSFWCTEADIKCTVVRSESVRNIIRERRMLEHLNHPFLCNLRYSFQDVEYLSVGPPCPLQRMLSLLQIYRRGPDEWGRPAVPHLEKNIY
jgi:hypothetical protein